MKRRSRADWDDEYWWPSVPSTGGLNPLDGESDEVSVLLATLWLPSPDTRSGWTTKDVFSDTPKDRPSMGFKR